MKPAALLVCLTYLTATTAVAIPSTGQAPLYSAEDNNKALGSDQKKATEAGRAVEEQAAVPVIERNNEPEAQVPVSDDQDRINEGQDEVDEASCFCSGSTICCPTDDGELDCGYGLCGIWI